MSERPAATRTVLRLADDRRARLMQRVDLIEAFDDDDEGRYVAVSAIADEMRWLAGCCAASPSPANRRMDSYREITAPRLPAAWPAR
jgi:hypothetical protein